MAKSVNQLNSNDPHTVVDYENQRSDGFCAEDSHVFNLKQFVALTGAQGAFGSVLELVDPANLQAPVAAKMLSKRHLRKLTMSVSLDDCRPVSRLGCACMVQCGVPWLTVHSDIER